MGRLSEISEYNKKRMLDIETLKKDDDFDYKYKIALLETLSDISLSLAIITDKMNKK